MGQKQKKERKREESDYNGQFINAWTNTIADKIDKLDDNWLNLAAVIAQMHNHLQLETVGICSVILFILSDQFQSTYQDDFASVTFVPPLVVLT